MKSLVLLALCLPVWDQTNFAVLHGNVQDPQSQPVQNAKVSAIAADTGAHRTTLTNDQGWFEVVGLAPGEYRIEVAAPGFTQSNTSVVLEVGQQLGLEVKLALGEKIESVNVAARADLLKTADASLGEVVETKSIQELPLNGRMLLDLAVTVPGSHVSHGAQAGDMNPL